MSSVRFLLNAGLLYIKRRRPVFSKKRTEYGFKVPLLSNEMIGTKNFVQTRKSSSYEYSVSA